MKKVMLLALVAGMSLFSCNNTEKNTGKDEAVEQANRQLESVEAQRDSLMSLVGDSNSSLIAVNRLENILSANDGMRETPSKRKEILNNIAALRQELENRRQALNDLERKLKNSNEYNASLKKMIDSQKRMIEEQAAKISELQNELQNANERISGLTASVDSLVYEVDNITAQREAETQRAENIADELNTCYYAVGSNKELKEHKILEKKFLGKTKIMESEYDREYFTKSDKRSLYRINTFAKKAKLMTKHAEGSYELVEVDGTMVLKILNPKLFWEKSNFLVIQID